jgi:hypothetical protein
MSEQQFHQGSGVQVGGDFNYYAGGPPRSSYEELDLEKLGQEIGLIPPGAEELAGAVATGHLLVIEPIELDGRAIARQVAWMLGELIKGKAEPPVKLREWSRDGGPLDLKTLLDGDGTKILLLTGGEPRDFAGSLWELKNHLAYHFAIITTEHAPNEWNVAEGSEQEKSFWRRVVWQSYFGSDFLEQQLAEALRLRFPPVDSSVHPALAGVSPAEVVSTLRDPRRIQAFVEALPEPPRELSAEGIREKLAEASGDLQQASLWYRDQRERDQLLAVGLMLFDGLPADQVFAGIETLVEEVWRVADPLLPQFDFLDVERLGRYFHRVQRDGEGYFWIAAEQRRQMLEVAWQLHRRRLLETLPALAELVRNAAVYLDSLEVQPDPVNGARQGQPPQPQQPQQPASQGASPAPQGGPPRSPGSEPHDRKLLWRMGRTRELYGTVRRMAGLKAAAVDGLSELGGLSAAAFEGIEPCLRQLAADKSGAVRAVAAGALVDSLRKPERRSLLLAKLGEWWRDGCQPVEWLSAGRRAEQEATRTTVALAAGLAAASEPPNGMAQELAALLSRLVEDRSSRVRRALREEVLYRVVSRHLRQLQVLVSTKIAAQADLLPGAAVSVAQAYWWSPADTRDVLEAWRERALPVASSPATFRAAAENEPLLSLLALSLGYLETDQDDAAFPPERIFRELRAILAASRRPAVRRYVLIAAGLQAVRNYDLAAPLLSDVLAEIALAERSILVEVFTRAYLEQRRQLDGGDETISIGAASYPAWIRQPRPQDRLTRVEQALFFWLQAWDQPVAQQVAAETFAALSGSALDRRERELAAQRQRQGVPQAAAVAVDAAIQPVRLRALGPLGWLALAAVTRGRELRTALWAPFAELLWIRRQAPVSAAMAGVGAAAAASGATSGATSTALGGPRMASSEEVLKRWRLAATNDSLRSLVDYLERAIELYRWRWAAVGGSCAALWLLWSVVIGMLLARNS